MRSTTINDPLHNPFKNRFHDPVSWRLDEMQAQSNAVWLQERTQRDTDHELSSLASVVEGESILEESKAKPALESNPGGGIFAGAFALLVVIIASVIVLF